jgi:hypothetical protein
MYLCDYEICTDAILANSMRVKTKNKASLRSLIFIYFQRDNYCAPRTGIIKAVIAGQKLFGRLIYFTNGFRERVKRSPALLSFILPAPMPLNGSFR